MHARRSDLGPERGSFGPKHFVVMIIRSLKSSLRYRLTRHLRDRRPVELGIDGVDRRMC